MRVVLAALFVALAALPARGAVPQDAAEAPVAVEVRVHGNHTTPEAEVIDLAGVAVGDRLPAGALQQITARLRASGRFRGVEVRARARAVDASHEVALILIVEESEVVRGGLLPRPIAWLRSRAMFLPILNYREGYGVTYGLRTSVVDVLGGRSRASVPLAWGGTRRAALELDKTFREGWIHRAEGGLSIAQREHPHFQVDDRRIELWARGERRLTDDLRVGAVLRWHDVDFDEDADRVTSYGADLTFDTRVDPSFPRDALYARVGWERLRFNAWPNVGRTSIDARGYVGLVRQVVLSVGGRYDGASGRLPRYQQPLLGGGATLRGFRAGTFAADNVVATSVEVRMPTSSPLQAGRAGIVAFWDSGAAYADGEALRRAPFHHGVGVGGFLLAPFFQLNVDVAYGVDNRVRVHVRSGLSF